jgi:tetratricopeptide (TPR) repeat protein
MKLHLLPVLCASLFLAPMAAQSHEADESGQGKLGTVKFATSCDAKVQPAFERAVAMLHSFWYSAAEKAFMEILDQDPSCAIATWGYASILMNNPLAGVGPTVDQAKKAQAALERGRRIGAGTERERDYIDAVGAYYENWENRPEKDRQLTRSKAYEALAAKYPNDDEAQIFNALYIAGTQSQADQTYAAYLKAAAVLEQQFKKHPDHPGVAHYLIHSYDAPPIAEKGLAAARVYAGIAPAAPHALHMPSHIFTRVGAWEESVATNQRSFEVAKAGGEPSEANHASDYAVYALLQLGRDEEARRTMERSALVTGPASSSPAAPYAAAAMPARYALERGDWKAAAQLQVTPSKMPFTEAITYFARALGEARTGDLAGAEADAANLAAAHKKLEEAKNRYWATEVEIQRLAVAGWIAHKQGKAEEGLKLMRAAADLEDRNEKHIVTPGRIVPARELLGEMLLEQKQPALALKEFEASQVREPNRFRNLYGSAVAAEAMGDRAKAASYYDRLVRLASKSDANRPEVARAKLVLGAR